MFSISDLTALFITALGILVAVLEIRTYRRNCKWPWRWIYLFKGFSGLYLGIVFLIAAFNGWAGDGRIDPVAGRIGAVLALTSLALGAVIQYRREGC